MLALSAAILFAHPVHDFRVIRALPLLSPCPPPALSATRCVRRVRGAFPCAGEFFMTSASTYTAAAPVLTRACRPLFLRARVSLLFRLGPGVGENWCHQTEPPPAVPNLFTIAKDKGKSSLVGYRQTLLRSDVCRRVTGRACALAFAERLEQMSAIPELLVTKA